MPNFDPTNPLHLRAQVHWRAARARPERQTYLQRFEYTEAELEPEVAHALPHLDEQAVSDHTTEIVEATAIEEEGP